MASNLRYVLYSLSYLKKYKFKLVLIFLMSVISVVISLVPVEIFKRIIDVAIPSKNLNMVLMMMIAVFGIHLIMLVINYIQDLMVTGINLKVTRKLQGDFFNKLLSLPYSHHIQLNKGQILERMVDDTEEVTSSTFDLIISPILDIIAIAITVTYMFIISWKLTLVALAFVPLLVIMILPINRIVRKKYTAIKKRYADVYNTIQEKIAGLKEIISNNRKNHELRDLEAHLKSYNDLEYDYEKFSLKLSSAISIIMDLAPYAVLLFATYEIIQGRFQVGTLLAFSMLMPRLFGPIEALASKEFEFQTLGVTAKRVFSTLHDTKPVKEGKETIVNVEGHISLNNICQSFGKNILFKNLNIDIKPKTMVAIVGPSGTGKTTILNLLLRTVEQDRGKILLDGNEIEKYTTKSVRHHMAVLNQEPFLFSDTILKNILYATPQGNIKKYTEMTGMDNLILRLPKKSHTYVDRESGILSEDQVRRLALSRALIREPEILLLDKPLEGMDNKSASKVANSLYKLRKSTTILVVTNNPAILTKADNIIILNRRNNHTIINEMGTHKQLLKNKLYRELTGF
ncbi:ABC transporter ATP-binding protein [Candidatus Woesearchaeota archaeon]|nr:ABC transporter ATP-binding protein [Candidatus Woesearchaeota archaeon]